MNEIIADKLAEQLFTLNYVTKASGLVESVTRTGRDGKTRIFPAARVAYGAGECDPDEDLIPMLPDGSAVGVLFFTSGSENIIRRTAVTSMWQGRLTAHLWVNTRRLTGALPSEVALSFLNSIPKKLASSGFLSAVTVSPVGFSNTDPWARYRLDEERGRYLTPPYAQYSVSIRYTAAVNYGCPLDVTTTKTPQC